VTVNEPLAGGTLGALSTVSELTNVSVLVVVVTEVAVAVVMVVVVDVGVVTELTVVLVMVVVVLVGICMLYVMVANRAAFDESPTGKVYVYTRGDVTPHTSNPSVVSLMRTVPLCAGKTSLKLPPMFTVLPSASDVARRKARSCAVPAASVVV